MEDFDQSAENSGMSRFCSRNKNRPSLSIFELAIEVLPTDKARETEYEDKLWKECKEWNDLLREKMQDAKRAEETKLEIDKSILTEAQRAYLERAPDLQKFVNESEEFCIKVQNYLLENSQIVEMHDRVTSMCKASLSKMSAGIISDCIYAQKSFDF